MINGMANRSEAAVRDSKYASATAGVRAVWKLGYEDGVSATEDRRIINSNFRELYTDGLHAGIAARGDA